MIRPWAASRLASPSGVTSSVSRRGGCSRLGGAEPGGELLHHRLEPLGVELVVAGRLADEVLAALLEDRARDLDEPRFAPPSRASAAARASAPAGARP